MIQMTINEIEINTSTLARTIEGLETTTGKLEEQIESMFRTVQELDQMWDGEANAAFNKQFEEDHTLCKDMCTELRAMIESLKHAKTEYDNCENRVNDLVLQLKI
ncbi:putative uncharacterized protein [Clostridium sp. CAG:43]|nr:putative uncharacterized protein [Clostridium sp. CAG:43]